jgi:gas vesicle protein
MEEKKDSCGTGLFLASLFIGFVAGLSVGFLYAPRRGVETRTRLRRQVIVAEAKAVKAVRKSTGVARQAIKNRL